MFPFRKIVFPVDYSEPCRAIVPYVEEMSRRRSVAESVREEAVRRGADLIVTGRGCSLGSFSEILSRLYPIVRHAPCPVLSV